MSSTQKIVMGVIAGVVAVLLVAALIGRCNTDLRRYDNELDAIGQEIEEQREERREREDARRHIIEEEDDREQQLREELERHLDNVSQRHNVLFDKLQAQRKYLAAFRL